MKQENISIENRIITFAFFTLFIAFNSFVNAQSLIDRITINDREKNITNLSGKLNNSNTFHLIINKNKETKEIKSTLYIYNKEKQIKSFPTIVTKDEPKYLTYHLNDNILTLINETENGIKITDYDYLNETIDSISIDRLKPKSIFSHENVTYLTSGFTNNKLIMVKVTSSKIISKMLLKSNNSLENSFLYNINSKDNCEFINDKQFIDKGSIKEYKGFYNNGKMIFLKDNHKKSTLSIFTIDDKGIISTKSIDINNKQKAKRQTSFLKDSLLFTFNMGNEKALLDIYNFSTLELKKRFEYTKDEFQPINKLIKNGKESTDNFKSSSFYKSYYVSIGSTYNPALYMNINKSKDKNYIIEVGHVDKNKYQNMSANNFWWNSSAFGYNYNINSGNISGAAFGIGAAQMIIYGAIADYKRQGNYFTLNLNNELTNTTNEQEPEYYNIDEKLYRARLSKVMSLKKDYLISLEDYTRLINYDKESNSYKIYNVTKI